jgi:hypothetical protein
MRPARVTAVPRMLADATDRLAAVVQRFGRTIGPPPLPTPYERALRRRDRLVLEAVRERLLLDRIDRAW